MNVIATDSVTTVVTVIGYDNETKTADEMGNTALPESDVWQQRRKGTRCKFN